MEPQKKILVVFDFDLTLTKTHFGKHLSKIGRQILLSLHNKKHFISNNETKYTEQYVKLYKDKYSDQEYTYIPEKDLTQQELDIYLKLLDDIIEEIGGFKKENFRDPDKLTTYLKKLKEKYNIIFCISTAGARFPVIKMVERIYPDIFDPDLINYDFYEFGGTMFKKKQNIRDLIKKYKPQFVIFFDDTNSEVEDIKQIVEHGITIKAVLVNKDVVDSKIDFTDFVKQNIDKLLDTTTGGKKSKHHRTTNKRKISKRKTNKRKTNKRKSNKRKSNKK